MGKYDKKISCPSCNRLVRSDKIKYHICKQKPSACSVVGCKHYVNEHHLRWHIKKYHPEDK